ncbi:MAG: nucleotidyltransferase domain-containing protein [Candidatus Kerfeldbacteria bacterium]|nr:nucleotidyltransferase domain-containing protein [Candidatus Kerfeldbacteria bacterium]
MPHPPFIQKVAEALKARFENFTPIRSAYLYGSVLTDHFSETSDIDVLFIVDDMPERNSFLEPILKIAFEPRDEISKARGEPPQSGVPLLR